MPSFTTLALTVDASNYALSAVLEQRTGMGTLSVLQRQVDGGPSHLATVRPRALRVVEGHHHFRDMVEGRDFILSMDHNSPIPAIHMKSEPHTVR